MQLKNLVHCINKLENPKITAKFVGEGDAAAYVIVYINRESHYMYPCKVVCSALIVYSTMFRALLNNPEEFKILQKLLRENGGSVIMGAMYNNPYGEDESIKSDLVNAGWHTVGPIKSGHSFGTHTYNLYFFGV